MGLDASRAPLGPDDFGFCVQCGRTYRRTPDRKLIEHKNDRGEICKGSGVKANAAKKGEAI